MKREGFTLVELLIVIVVIGILSAMVMMSSTEAVTSSRASNIVSNLRNIKAATLALYSDSIDTFISEPDKEITLDDVQPYLETGKELPDMKNFLIRNFLGRWYVYYDLGDSNTIERTRLSGKIRRRALSAGLLGTNDPENSQLLMDDYVDHQYVGMRIR